MRVVDCLYMHTDGGSTGVEGGLAYSMDGYSCTGQQSFFPCVCACIRACMCVRMCEY